MSPIGPSRHLMRGKLWSLSVHGGLWQVVRPLIYDFTAWLYPALRRVPVDYRPNSRSTNQPSSPAAASGRAFGLGGGAEVRAGGGRYEPPGEAGAAGLGAALTCEVWNRFEMKPPRCELGNAATGTP
jgi:hypothetical protein